MFIKNLLLKPFVWAGIVTVSLVASSVGVLLDTFVVQSVGTSGEVIVPTSSASSSETSSSQESSSSTATSVASSSSSVSSSSEATSTSSSSETSSASSSSSVITPTYTADSYTDSHMSLTITTYRKYDTTIFAAEVIMDDPLNLRAALANNTYGQNITQPVSTMATNHQAIFAINGDYYGYAKETTGFVVRNGIGYRYTANKSDSGKALVMNSSGVMSVITEANTSKTQLLALSPWQVWSFGPPLVNGGTIQVTSSTEVDQSSSSNPRTGIGYIAPGHYVFIVSNGRLTNESGLTLLELAQEFVAYGCGVAYNMDGGGSSDMWFNGTVLNTPSDGHERSVSDCVYLGYQ